MFLGIFIKLTEQQFKMELYSIMHHQLISTIRLQIRVNFLKYKVIKDLSLIVKNENKRIIWSLILDDPKKFRIF